MSIEHMTAVLHHSQAAGTDKLVLLGIANHAGDGGAWPSIDTLTKYANCSERSVQRAIRKLEAMGELVARKQSGGLGPYGSDWHRPNLYQVLVQCPAWCDRTPQHRSKHPSDKPQKVIHRGDTSVTPPGDTSVTPPGDTSVTPPGDTSVTLTISKNHQLKNPVTAVTPTRSYPQAKPADPEVRGAALAKIRENLGMDQRERKAGGQ